MLEQTKVELPLRPGISDFLILRNEGFSLVAFWGGKGVFDGEKTFGVCRLSSLGSINYHYHRREDAHPAELTVAELAGAVGPADAKHPPKLTGRGS